MADNRPIGVLDSGLGGLTVWRELKKQLPHESMIYYGDGKNCPYGPKSDQEVITIVDKIVRGLIERDVKMVVVACNAATAAAIDHLRASYPIPFIGMEPAVKPAALASKTGVIGILATAATLNGRLFKETSARYADRAKILSHVGEGFVELVEANAENSPEAEEAVRRSVSGMLAEGADQLVLGCTHYPFLADTIRRVAGPGVTLIDPAPAVAHRAAEVLYEKGLEAAEDHHAVYEFDTSYDEAYLKKLIEKSKIA